MEAFGEKNLPTSFANSSTVVMESVVCESILISMAVQCDVTTFNHVLIAMATEMLSWAATVSKKKKKKGRYP